MHLYLLIQTWSLPILCVNCFILDISEACLLQVVLFSFFFFLCLSEAAGGRKGWLSQHRAFLQNAVSDEM